MNREEMLERLKKGEDALELSIQKWTDIINEQGSDTGEENCALCELYFADDCKGCPVRNKTGRRFCNETPYADVRYAVTTEQASEASKMELEFLKSLRGEKHERKNP